MRIKVEGANEVLSAAAANSKCSRISNTPSPSTAYGTGAVLGLSCNNSGNSLWSRRCVLLLHPFPFTVEETEAHRGSALFKMEPTTKLRSTQAVGAQSPHPSASCHVASPYTTNVSH